MKTVTTKMTLGEFISQMQAGWGFARPYRVMRIGDALNAVIPADLRNKEVEVEYWSGTIGYGPNGYYTYHWKVKGVRLPIKEGFLPPSKTDEMFGYNKRNLPFLYVDEDSFSVGYNW